MISPEPELFIKVTTGDPKKPGEVYDPVREIVISLNGEKAYLHITSYGSKIKSTTGIALSDTEAGLFVTVFTGLESESLIETPGRPSFGFYGRLGDRVFSQNHTNDGSILPYLKAAAQIQGIAINLAKQQI